MIKVCIHQLYLRYKCRAKLLLARAAETLYLSSPEKKKKKKETNKYILILSS